MTIKNLIHIHTNLITLNLTHIFIKKNNIHYKFQIHITFLHIKYY